MGLGTVQIQPIDLEESVIMGENLPFSSHSVFHQITKLKIRQKHFS
jgi:hypothetical protein